MEKNQIKVLLAEDDRNLGNILKNYLEVKDIPPFYVSTDRKLSIFSVPGNLISAFLTS